LQTIIESLLGSKEFFINKAIGWILREYSKIHPQWVLDYAQITPLSNLSKREALKVLMRKNGGL
jgi:3-methyladenine DNA glycosylase AlkD